MTQKQLSMINKDRRLAQHPSEWAQSFICTDVKPLIVCRGPIRKEAMDVFEEMGIEHYGILLSEKDSITYTHALAPELRSLTDHGRVHRVPDYTGASKEERMTRIQQLIQIAHDNDYNSIYAGYGFMAEDETFVSAIEEAGLNFIGPCSGTVRGAGQKDEAKRTAENVGVSITPGIDNVTTLTLLKKYPKKEDLQKLVADQALDVPQSIFDENKNLEDIALQVLDASYRAGIDLFSIEELAASIKEHVARFFNGYPKNRVRLKAIGGGGGKGQRIIPAPKEDDRPLEKRIEEACEDVPSLVREILSEVKANGVGDNKNMLIELNIEYTRHQEIQLIGNGDWCISLGARDCSIQMHEQKLLEISVTEESLKANMEKAKTNGQNERFQALSKDLEILLAMEDQATRFGQAVGLDSLSTFECIVDRERHFFMEMNTRIQVEHRVSELCYSLKFTNPSNEQDSFVVDSLVEMMVLLARHGDRLPKPTRVYRNGSAVEARLNATNAALAPHAGGIIHFWSEPLEHEIRDDQGISCKNPDRETFVKYRLAGAYDSNIALLVTYGERREESYARLYEILRRTKLQGHDLATNLEFHYGLINWLIGNDIHARATTAFVLPYLTLLGQLKQKSNDLDILWALNTAKKQAIDKAKEIDTTDPAYHTHYGQCFDKKKNLLARPLNILLNDPHLLAGWLSIHKNDFSTIKGKLSFNKNPITLLEETYHFLNMDFREGALAAEVIWKEDHLLLKRAHDFYENLQEHLRSEGFPELNAALRDEAPANWDGPDWNQVQGAHQGFMAGLEVLLLLPFIAQSVGFYDLKVNEDLSIEIPERLKDKELQKEMMKVLVPPPGGSADELVAPSGGMYYPREAPGMETFINEGDHFEKGQALFIIEVMKMFNKVIAPFSGTVDKILVEGDGVIVAKGQPIFKVTPDEKIEVINPETLIQQRRSATTEYMVEIL